jgi:hypothetical protein
MRVRGILLLPSLLTEGNMGRKYLVMAVMALVGGLCFSGFSLAQKQADPSKAPAGSVPSSQVAVPRAPQADLAIQRFEITKLGESGGKHQVRVNVEVRNNGASTADALTAEGRRHACGGCFKNQLDWKYGYYPESRGAHPSGTDFVRLCETGTVGLAAGATAAFQCDDEVIKDGMKEYKLILDHLFWIDDRNRFDNVQTKKYWAR